MKNYKCKGTEEPPAQEVKNKPLSAQQLKKLKKIKEKYGEQSDEERQARLKLLGSKEVKFAHLIDKTEKNEIVEELKEENVENLSKILESKEENSDNLENKEEIKEESSESEEKPAPSMTSEDHREKTQIQQILEDENILGEEDMKALGETDSLTGNPLKEDTLLFCMPMCAPHIATTAYKYRIKLVPGNLKKGKAVNLITYTWLSMQEASEAEKQLIKAMSETELITVITGKVSIASAATKKIQQMNKKGK